MSGACCALVGSVEGRRRGRFGKATQKAGSGETRTSINGRDIRDLTVESVERRFGLIDTPPEPIEYLSDNGSPYTAADTRAGKTDRPGAVHHANREPAVVRFLGEIENTPARIERTVKKLAARYGHLQVCFEAGPTGYGLYRQIQELGTIAW
ncbi:MAG: hypothetical protein JOZ17_19100 [Acetobacteraceae bacterium]|nr:hypothetical protein [Acetobacteraceae bacterium]